MINDDGMCLSCGTKVPEGPLKIGKLIEAEVSWWSWEDVPERGVKVITGVGPVTMVAKHTQGREYMGDDYQPLFMVFSIGDKFYRKNGHSDSYGETSWDGAFTEVQPAEKIVTVYE